MFHPWIMLGLEANRVIGLRLTKLMLGGRAARREARLMVAEKLDAAFKANARMATGASPDEIIRMYRRRVAANYKRLGKFKSNRSRSGRRHRGK
jgi:hypothetical protein